MTEGPDQVDGVQQSTRQCLSVNRAPHSARRRTPAPAAPGCWRRTAGRAGRGPTGRRRRPGCRRRHRGAGAPTSRVGSSGRPCRRQCPTRRGRCAGTPGPVQRRGAARRLGAASGPHRGTWAWREGAGCPTAGQPTVHRERWARKGPAGGRIADWSRIPGETGGGAWLGRGMGDVVWRPDPAVQGASPLARLLERHGCATYADLHRWSVEHPGRFWREAWDDLGIVGDPGAASIEGEGVLGTRFFPQARLNVVDTLLAGAPDVGRDRRDRRGRRAPARAHARRRCARRSRPWPARCARQACATGTAWRHGPPTRSRPRCSPWGP